MIDWLNNITILFERGGPILWAILAASILMWVLILEAYRVFFFDLKPHRRQVLRRWETTKWRNNPPKNYLLTRMQTAFEAPIRRHLKLISVLVEILPLLGLLGTITGMIKVFDVITLFGAGNARAMAAGISEALITTMADW
ncbi:MotA/TolQ/ExbB proton channel family protein [Thiomicrorhabdus sp.]|uniref:MotA/TolQ/ExbB proton channel family protein n=1 Tax=Thiomicrorhabdus sp. TaxID=2039724 RepID=UPI0029C87E9C|nr:MotA/TolQ/ExbB proton channel family protein [Thiomicrorhabdus sp.]